LGYEHYQNPAHPNSSNAHGRGVIYTYKKNVVEMRSQIALKTKKIVHIIFSKRKNKLFFHENFASLAFEIRNLKKLYSFLSAYSFLNPKP
jgi:hypothetical protein